MCLYRRIKYHLNREWKFLAPVIRIFFKKIFQSLRILKKSDVASNVSHKRANYQFEIICILSYRKMTSVDMSIVSNAHYQISKRKTDFVIFLQPIIKGFALRFCMIAEYIIDNVQNSLQFSETCKYDFEYFNFNIEESMELGS
jgi:hypothetical protein